MSGMEAIAIGAVVGGIATSVVGRQMQGQEQAISSEFEQQQLKNQEQMTRIAATQDEAKRRSQLTSSLETIDAIRSGRGVGLRSPTGNAILSHVTDVGESDIFSSKINYLAKADQSRMAAEMAGRKARMSLLAADIGSATDIFGGISKIAGPYAYPKSASA